jgi:hypothetical protein
MTPAESAAKWRDSTAKESVAEQEQFIDLCRILGVPTPNERDPTAVPSVGRRTRRVRGMETCSGEEIGWRARIRT